MDTVRESPTHPQPTRSFPAEPVAIALALGGLAAAVVLGLLSDGFYQDDGVSHFRFAFDAWGSTTDMLHWWARPGYNIPAMFVVRAFWVLGGHDMSFAMLGCRLFSAVQTALVAYLSYRIARLLVGASFTAAVVPALVWLQPLAMTLATTTLTETPAALYLTLGVWLYLRGNRVWACVALSPTFVTRMETLALAPVFAGAVIVDVLRASGWRALGAVRKPWAWACAAALLWAPAAYVLASAAADMPGGLSPVDLVGRRFSGLYGSGSWVHFIQFWPEAAGLGVLVLALAGAIRLGRKGWGSPPPSRRAGTAGGPWLVWSLVYGLFALHTVLYRYGLFESGGYSRFLVPVCGLVGVLAAVGLTAAWQDARRSTVLVMYVATPAWLLLGATALVEAIRQHPAMLRDPVIETARIFLPFVVLLVLTGSAAVLPVVVDGVVRDDRRRLGALGRWGAAAMLALCAVHVIAQVRPLRLDRSSEHYVAVQAVQYVRGTPYAEAPGLAQHTLIVYMRRNTRPCYGNEDAIRKWQKAPPPAVFFWDSKYCDKPEEPDSTRLLRQELERLGERIFQVSDRGKSIEVFARKPDRKGPQPCTEPAR